MRAEIKLERYDLVPGELGVLTGCGGRVLLCEQGRVWLTEEGIGEDVTLEAGACYRVRGDGKLLLEAAGSARLRFLPAGERTATPRLSLAA